MIFHIIRHSTGRQKLHQADLALAAAAVGIETALLKNHRTNKPGIYTVLSGKEPDLFAEFGIIDSPIPDSVPFAVKQDA